MISWKIRGPDTLCLCCLTQARSMLILGTMTRAEDDKQLCDEKLAERVARRTASPHARMQAESALLELYTRYSSRLLAYLSSRVPRSDLDDAFQEVWARVWQHLPGRFTGGNFRAWLYQIAGNHVIDLHRKRRPEALTDEARVPDHRPGNPGEELAEQERRDILARCLARLASQEADLVRARLAGESIDAISVRLGLQAQQIYKRFHTAKLQLQECVGRNLA